MKKLIYNLTFILMAITISAQENTTDLRERFLIGLKAGLNYSNVYDAGSEDFNPEPIPGLAAGLFVAIPINRYFGIQPEALIAQRGFRATGRILGSSYSLTRTTTYLDFPLLFAIKPSEFITILAGPQFSYLLKKTDRFANGSTSIEQEKEFENNDLRKNTLCVTGGVDLTLKHIVLSARVGWDIQDNNASGSATTPHYKNMWYQGCIGYRFYK